MQQDFDIKISIRFLTMQFHRRNHGSGTDLYCFFGTFGFVFENTGKRPIAIIKISLTRQANDYSLNPLPMTCGIQPLIINPGTMVYSPDQRLYVVDIAELQLTEILMYEEIEKIHEKWKSEKKISIDNKIQLALTTGESITTTFNQFYID